MTKGPPPIELRQAHDAADWAEARVLFEAYASELDVDLCFQGFAAELADLPAAYREPGGLWLASRRGRPVGCVGLRGLEPGVGELKRLFVVPGERGSGAGRVLVEAALRTADGAGFRAVRLDTLPAMRAAQALYRSLGFRTIAPYRNNPVPGAEFLQRTRPVSRG